MRLTPLTPTASFVSLLPCQQRTGKSSKWQLNIKEMVHLKMYFVSNFQPDMFLATWTSEAYWSEENKKRFLFSNSAQFVTYFLAKLCSLLICLYFWGLKKGSVLGLPLCYNNHNPHPATLPWDRYQPPLYLPPPQDRQPIGISVHKHPEAFSLAEQLRKFSKRMNHVWPELALEMLFRAEGATFAA